MMMVTTEVLYRLKRGINGLECLGGRVVLKYTIFQFCNQPKLFGGLGIFADSLLLRVVMDPLLYNAMLSTMGDFPKKDFQP